MHLYYSNAKQLEKGFNEFVGGQFQMKTKDWVFRGQIKECMALSNRRIKIYFDWLCERHFFFDSSGVLQPRWSLLVAPPGLHHLDVEFRYFYFQTDEDRIKVKGQLGEICHLCRSDDYTNLVQHGDEFAHYCNLHMLKLCQSILVLLKQNCG